ncbi:MAG: ATP-binding protein [Phycisphaerales bacterium]|nr:ATP-binding protein [Phycisphaerales bacterium]
MISSTSHDPKNDPLAIDLTEVLAKLQIDHEAIPWHQRRLIVSQIAGPLAEGLAGEPFRSLLLLLIDDPKWEVRHDVAAALGAIPDHDLAVLTEKFLTDSHAYVRRAAERSIARRRKAALEAQKRKRGINLVLALYQELEDQHGKTAANKARRLAEVLYDTLIGATVHEMRSVLTALKEDNAQIVARDHSGQLEPSFLRRKSLKIADRLAFMERLLQDMRNYAQPVSDDRVVVTVTGLLLEARSIVSENLKARNIHTHKVVLSVSVPTELKAKVSRVHMVTALVNVLKNAYDFLPTDNEDPSGQIHINAELKGKHIHLVVQDSGIGIPSANLEEVRQCLPGRTSRRHMGTGFGLCNARRFVEAHGGKLFIDSQENIGTTVTLVLPTT